MHGVKFVRIGCGRERNGRKAWEWEGHAKLREGKLMNQVMKKIKNLNFIIGDIITGIIIQLQLKNSLVT